MMMDKMDVGKIYLEVYTPKIPWLNLTSLFWELDLHLTEVEHPDKERLKRILDGYTQDELDNLKEACKNAEKPTTLRVFISDLENIGKSLQECELLKNENERLRGIEKRLEEAKEVYHKTAGRQEKKLREVAKIIGLTKNGKRQKKISQKKIFLKYISFLKDPDPMDKWEALELVAEKFELSSSDAARQHVQGYLKEFKKNYEFLCSIKDLSCYTSNPKNKPDQFEGILPPVGIYKKDTT